MSVPFSLLAKAIGGVAAVASPIATGIVYREEIKGLFVSNELSPIKEHTAPDSKVAENSTDQQDQKQTEEESLRIEGEESTNLKIVYSDNKECAINITGTGNVKTELTKLLGSSNLTENNKRYRRGIIKKCKDSTSDPLSLNVSEGNINLSSLFELSKENLSTEEANSIENKEFKIENSIDKTSLTITVTVNYDTSVDSSVKECKIIGSQMKDSSTINETKLESSKDEIKKSIEDKINPSKGDKTTNRKNFLTECKRSWGNEIKRSLKEKNGDTNKYEFEGLDEIFQSTTNTQ